jgi:adenylate cyclase
VNAHLIDATTGQHVWAERYERPAENLPLAQKEITQTIVGMIASGWGELERAELERVRRTPQQDLQAYDLYLLGVAHKNRKTREDNSLARQMFEEAIRADPKHARAMAECSLTYLTDVYNQWTHDREEWLQTAEEWARRAIEIDPSEPWGLVALGLIYQLKARNDEALALLERAHALNPNDYYVKEALGYALTYAGEAERLAELLKQAQRLNHVS